jgi:hypothetical protein
MTDAYVILAGKLGYSESDSLGRLLRTLMDEEEAEMAVCLPGPVAELAQKLGKQKDQVSQILKAFLRRASSS